MPKFFPSLLLFLLLCTCGRAPEKEVIIGQAVIIPQPTKLVVRDGHFFLPDNPVVSVETKAQAEQLTNLFEQLAQVSGQKATAEIGGGSNIRLITQASMEPEGYELDVTPERIEIRAADNAGFFYALQSLQQLLPPEFASDTLRPNTNWAIPAVSIKDAPNFGWRGFMLDVSRHFFTVEEVKGFHWHLTDDQGWRIEIKAYPKLTSIGAWRADRINTDENISDWWGRAPLQADEQPTYGGFYTQEEIREVVAYAKARHIEVIPEIDMPGHCQAAVAAYPEIGCVKALPAVATGGVFRYNTLNPGKDETYTFAEAVLNEVMDLFPFEYVHIGGDECNKEQWKIDPDVQRKMKAKNLKDEAEMQSFFIRQLEGYIMARNRKMIGWDEILEGGLAPNAVVMSWRGEEGGLASARAGHEVIMTPSKHCYIDLKQGHDDFEPNLGYSRSLLSDAYNYRVVPEDLTAKEGNFIKGIQANLWTESISDCFTERLLQANKRLDAQGVRYAVSAFSPWPHHSGKDNGIEVSFKTEVNGLDLRYTTDGSTPTAESTQYTGPVLLGQNDEITAQNFRKGKAIGYPVTLDLPIHLAANSTVKDRSRKTIPKLTDLQYARLTPVDTNWHKTGNELLFTLSFAEPTTVSSLNFSTLRYTISAIYPPHTVEVLGAAAGAKFSSLGALDQADEAALQGRNKVSSALQFPPTEVTALQVRLKAFAKIPKGHHRAGGKARIYLDELVVE